jgi:hypothetical protein
MVRKRFLLQLLCYVPSLSFVFTIWMVGDDTWVTALQWAMISYFFWAARRHVRASHELRSALCQMVDGPQARHVDEGLYLPRPGGAR